MKILRLTILLGCAFNSLTGIAASQFRLSMKEKQNKIIKIVMFQDASVHVEGYAESDLIITGKDVHKDTALSKNSDMYADISSFAVQTGKRASDDFNPQIHESNETIELILQPTNDREIFIQVPKFMHFSLQFISNLPHSELSLTNLSGELMISANVPSILLSNITGPLSLSTSGLNLKKTINLSHIKWSNTKQARPLFVITSIDADVTFCLPVKLKATFSLAASHSRIYSDLPSERIKLNKTGKDRLEIDLNGGGPSIFINSEYGNILLQKEP